MIFVFGKRTKTTVDNVIFIGKNADYPSLENYLSTQKNFTNYDFTKNHLQISYFEDDDIFITREHDNPLQLRLDEPTILRNCRVISSEDEIKTVIKNIKNYKEDDYDIFSGDEITTDNKEDILESIATLKNVLYQFLNAGYLNLKNVDKVDDWIVSFQEPILDIFVRYFGIPTSSGDILFVDEFLNNPYLRKDITIIIMKILSNFLINNNYISLKNVSKFKSWENIELWENIKNDF